MNGKARIELAHNSPNHSESARLLNSVNCVQGSEQAEELLTELRASGVWLSIDSDGRLAFDAPADVMTDELLARVRAVRDELPALVERFEERAAIAEPDGGMSRADAERLASKEIFGPKVEHSVVPETVEMPEGVRCPYCPGRLYVDAPGGCRCVQCGRLAWVLLPSGSIVRADFEKVIL